MPNANRPSGFAPVQYLNGAPWNGQARLYSVAAAYASALYIGDPVVSSGTADVNGVPGIALATAVAPLRGVIVGLGTYEGLVANPLDLNKIYRPAAAPEVWYAMVVDDPAVIFEVQEESNGTALAATEVGMNTISKVGTGNGFLSGWQIPSTTGAAPAVTATLQLRLLGLVRRRDNAFGAYAKWLVLINVHELGHGAGAAGI